MPSKTSIRAWLSPEFFDWWCASEGAVDLDETAWRRAYEHLRHAEEVLRTGTDSMSRVDAVSTLKRCLNQRLQHLKNTYAFEKIPLPNWPKRLLDQMAELGMVRPFLLQHLMEVRNQIEHADARPPNPRRCNELVDVLWYFLRSTDPFAKFWHSGFCFEEPSTSGHGEYAVVFNAHPSRSWRIEVSGWLEPKWISTRKHPARIETNCTVFKRVEELPPVPGNTVDLRTHLKPGTIKFEGTVLGPPQAIARLIKRYFQVWW